MNIEKVTINKVINGGFGLGHLSSGQVILIHRALPDEIVEVTIEKARGNTLFGKIERIIKPHRARRKPPCEYYDRCGGCDLQHCDTATQLAIKKEILYDLLRRSPETLLHRATDLLLDPVCSPTAFGYRQRIRLRIDSSGQIGFRQFRSHKIVHVSGCLLAEKSINKCLQELNLLTGFSKLIPLTAELELLHNPATHKIVCLFHLTRKPRPADIKAARSICSELELLERIFFLGDGYAIMGPFSRKGEQVGKQLHLCYAESETDPAPLKLQWEAGGFCQVNLEQNKQLISIVSDLCKFRGSETVLDLFCGMGNFSIPLARKARKLTGIEGQGSSIRSAKSNALGDGLTNTEFIKSPIHAACKTLQAQNARFDCVVADPPRQGIPGLATALVQLTRKKLIYISCDPATLCRDLAELVRNGFTIKTIQPVDMFPQTHHIETVVLLAKMPSRN